MFERNQVDNSRDLTAVTAKIELTDGRHVSGRFLIARSKSLIDVLNGPAQFIDFEPYSGDVEVISKSSIRSLRIVSVPTGRNPSTIIKDADNFNPYEVLGLEKGAKRSAVRAAFHQLSKTYHPDRYSSAELPGEVMEYLQAMARRINAAHEVLVQDTAKAEAFAAQRTEPVYTSGPAA
ncbi:MAG: J domain-containing protein [Hyphomicrobiaceae bacterium]